MMMQGLEQSSAELVNPQGKSNVLLVCGHASHYIPDNFANLGLSEVTEIPGNKDLTKEQRNYRIQHIYETFHQEIAAQVATRKAAGRETILVTIHSFTPVFMGKNRAVQLGVISHESNTFARDFYLSASKRSGFDIRMNEPYGPTDPVLHMVTRHGDEQHIRNIMLEVRNDLIVDEAGQQEWAKLVADTLNSLA